MHKMHCLLTKIKSVLALKHMKSSVFSKNGKNVVCGDIIFHKITPSSKFLQISKIQGKNYEFVKFYVRS